MQIRPSQSQNEPQWDVRYRDKVNYDRLTGANN